MKSEKKIAALFALSFAVPVFAAEIPVTEGWENSNPARREFPATAAVWKMPESGLAVEMVDGAEGSVAFEKGALKIVKKNGAGKIVVKAPAAKFKPRQVLRFMADVEVFSAKPDVARG